MNSQLPRIASLDGEELLSHLLNASNSEIEDRTERITLGQLVRTYVSSRTSRLPNAVLRQLEGFEATEDQLLPIKTTINIAGLLFDTSDETMRFFLSRNVVATVVALLDGILGIRVETTSSQEDRLETCISCFMLIFMAMRCTNGVLWVVEAFENDFLSILLKATDEVKQTQGLEDFVRRLNDIIGKIIETTPVYMSYYSVIAALSTIKGRRTAARAVRAQESGPLKDKWVTLFNLITERCTVQGLLSLQLRRVPIQCANVECIVEARRRDMHRCAGCLCTFYCSPSCQRKAWKHGDHKAKCNSPDTREGLFTQGSRDLALLPILCEASIVKNMFSICAQARKKFPSLPTHEISFSIDFIAKTPKVEVLHLYEVMGIVPNLSGMILAAASSKQFVCLSTHAFSVDFPISPLPRTRNQIASAMDCKVLYNLLEALRQPVANPDNRKECLESAKQASQIFASLFDGVSLDLRSFLQDSSRKKWSSWDAKDIVCKAFDQIKTLA